MTSGLYQRFDTPGMAARDRFEYWRGWYSEAIDVPMRLEPVHRHPHDFSASAEALAVGDVDIVEYRFGAAIGSWTREAIEATDRLRLVIVAPASGACGSWHRHELSLADGAALLLGRTDGRFRAPHGLRAIQVNVPREAIAVTDAQLDVFNDQRRLRRDPGLAWLIRPALLGLAGHLDSLAGTDCSELSEVWISLLNMLTRSLAGTDTNGTDTTHARRLQARRCIRANLANPHLSPSTIADALHVSRSTLYAALGPDTNGVAAEIRRQRLQRAHTMLRDPTNTQPIADIAASVGIPSAAHFSRLFREQYGLAPRERRAETSRTTTGEHQPNNTRAGPPPG
jgi:AraC-like DNA-binding protein